MFGALCKPTVIFTIISGQRPHAGATVLGVAVQTAQAPRGNCRPWLLDQDSALSLPLNQVTTMPQSPGKFNAQWRWAVTICPTLQALILGGGLVSLFNAVVSTEVVVRTEISGGEKEGD